MSAPASRALTAMSTVTSGPLLVLAKSAGPTYFYIDPDCVMSFVFSSLPLID
jgi:hypothetical protein